MARHNIGLNMLLYDPLEPKWNETSWRFFWVLVTVFALLNAASFAALSLVSPCSFADEGRSLARWYIFGPCFFPYGVLELLNRALLAAVAVHVFAMGCRLLTRKQVGHCAVLALLMAQACVSLFVVV